MRAILAVARHIVVLDHGQKIAEGNPREVVANLDVIRAYLGTDYAQAVSVGERQC
jgi:branched-chain amino acid transport system ATP-binding protein